jgi:hypothetical protein
MKLNSKMKDVDYVISEADNVITEINDTSKTILNEIDKKHEEMLFLYNLIGEKEKVLVSGNDESRTAEVKYRADIKPKTKFPVKKPKRVTTNVPVTNNEAKKVYKNPKLDEIKELKQQGMSLDDIAKQMNMGKGEISVMLALAASGNKAPKAGGANE